MKLIKKTLEQALINAQRLVEVQKSTKRKKRFGKTSRAVNNLVNF